MTLSILQHRLLTEDHTRLFAEEFRRETARQDQSVIDRLVIVTREIDNLAANMLAAVASPALLMLLADREAQKARLEGQLSAPTTVMPSATILPHPALLQLFEEKVGRLRETLDAGTVRGEAAEILSTLIESVTIYPNEPNGPEAEVVAKVSDLVAFATNDNAAPKGGVCSSTEVVAGTVPTNPLVLSTARCKYYLFPSIGPKIPPAVPPEHVRRGGTCWIYDQPRYPNGPSPFRIRSCGCDRKGFT